MKYLLILTAGLFIWFAIHRSRHSGRTQDHGMPKSQGRFVCCAHCGVYLPEGESVRQDNSYFCSSSHARSYTGARQK